MLITTALTTTFVRWLIFPVIAFILVTGVMPNGASAQIPLSITQSSLKPPQKRIISGIVTNERGDTLRFIPVKIVGTKEGSVSTMRGIFTIHTEQSGTVTLSVKNLAYEPFEQTVQMNDDARDTTRFNIRLLTKVIVLKEAVVGASAFSASDIKTATLKALDVVTTPGAAADIFRALQTFPGVTNGDDGSTLLVRGGDASETISLLDQATIVHPYRYESPTGGAFGTNDWC